MTGYPSALANSADYAEWLSAKHWNWTDWWTGTFGKWVPSEWAALKAWRSAVTSLPEGVSWFCCVERGELFGRTHLHALFAGLSRDSKSDLEAEWRKRYGFTAWRDYRRGGGAVGYAAKYCTKDMALWDVKTPHAAMDPRDLPSVLEPFRPGPGSYYGSSIYTQRNRESLPRSLSRRAALVTSRWHCSTGGFEVIDKGLTTVLRTPIDLRTFLTQTVSVGPSTSGIRASGVGRSAGGSVRISRGRHGVASGSPLTGITSRLRRK